MSERTRQTILAAFLAGVLGVSVGAVWLFASQRRGEVTALGQRMVAPELGFAIQMPKEWERVAGYKWLLAKALVYRQPLKPGGVDRIMRRRLQRRVFFLAIPPNASDEEVLAPLGKLALFWDINDNHFHSFKPSRLGPPRLDNFGYERREGLISFLYKNHHGRFVLIRYQQIRAGGRVFWCVMAGNTELTEADRALLEAVASSFELLGERIQRSEQS